MIELLKQFPAVWAIVGGLMTALCLVFVAVVVLRRFGPLQTVALNGLVGVYEKQISANERALNTLKGHYELELEVIRGEREDYKQKLHAEREKNQALILSVADLEQRPNIDKVYESQKEFFTKNTITMEAILKTIQEHDASLETRTLDIIRPVQEMCSEVVKALNGHKLVVRARKGQVGIKA